MKNILAKLFNDSNTINEKSVVGFIAFFLMIIFAIVDIVQSFMGNKLLVNEFIFNSFLWLVLGCFGIGSVDKWINKTKKDPTE